MAQFHFVEDYKKYVDNLINTHPIDEAMSLAVGGNYHEIGRIEADLLKWAGLKPGMSVIDFGCGSGRLGAALGKTVEIDYLGIDIVQSLLDYAASVCPKHYRFKLNHSLRIPENDGEADLISAFSVFTHLLPSETYLYLEDMRRVLKPRGTVVFTFLEASNQDHWSPFKNEVESRRLSGAVPLNTLIDRVLIQRMCDELGYTIEQFVDGTDAPWGTSAIWQSTAILRSLS